MVLPLALHIAIEIFIREEAAMAAVNCNHQISKDDCKFLVSARQLPEGTLHTATAPAAIAYICHLLHSAASA